MRYDNIYIDLNGKSYWYEQSGRGEAVILLHGFTGSAATWDQLIQELGNKYQFISLDLPGHRYTNAGKARTMEAFCDDLADLIVQLDIKYAHLIGYSMGGRSALSFAVRYPEYVASLILEGASPGIAEASERRDREKRDNDLAEWLQQEGLTSFVSYWEKRPIFESQSRLPASTRERLRKERLSHTASGLAKSLQYMGTGAQPSLWDHLKNLLLPVLLIAGEHDKKFINIHQTMKQLLPYAEQRVVQNAGHAVHIECPTSFIAAVNQFLQTHIKNY